MWRHRGPRSDTGEPPAWHRGSARCGNSAGLQSRWPISKNERRGPPRHARRTLIRQKLGPEIDRWHQRGSPAGSPFDRSLFCSSKARSITFRTCISACICVVASPIRNISGLPTRVRHRQTSGRFPWVIVYSTPRYSMLIEPEADRFGSEPVLVALLDVAPARP